MGCSPSKGRQNSSGSQGPFRTGRTLLPRSRESAGGPQLDGGGSGGSSCRGETDGAGGGGERRSAVPPVLSQKDAHSRGPSLTEVVLKGARPRDLGTHEIEINVIPQGTEAQGDASGKKGVRKSKKNKGSKPGRKKDKDKKAPAVEAKVDFPEPLVKAHQAAYAFLNPSIAKYEALLGLLEQAAQTHVSLQPMAAFMALRHEEVNCGLKEMAEEGERLLKESGEHLAWPCPPKNLSAAPSPKAADAGEPPPDLLQQLLQYTAQRMRLVSRSVGGIGDSALEEAVEYFASLSELLDEKLKTKRALDARLGQVLARIESAALRRPGPEDSALYSEDSGIGAESESLAGSEHQHNRRESCESTSTTRTGTGSPSARGSTPISLTGRLSTSISLTSLDSICTITAIETRDTESLLGSASLDDGEGEEEEEDEEEDGDDEAADKQAGGKRSGSSPADPCQPPRRLPPKRIENPQNVEMTLKMKDAISGRIRFLHSQRAGARASKQAGGGPANSGPQWTEEEGGPQAKRPQTAAPSSARGPRKKASVAKEWRSRSAESLRSRAEDPTLLELERTQKDLSQRLERMGKGGAGGAAQGAGHKRGGGEQAQAAHSPAAGRLSSSLDRNTAARPSRDKAAHRRRSSGEHGPGSEEDEKKKKEKKAGKGPLRATPPPGTPPPSPSGFLRGRNSVKRLIDTFSQGLDEKRSQRTPELGPLRGVRKCGVPVMPGLEGGGETPWGNSPNNSGSCRVDSRASDRTEDLDLDSLPPPPPEVLMDTSFEGAQDPTASESGDDVPARRGRSLLPRKTTVTQRLRASMQPVAVLPSRNSLRRGSVSVSPARPAHRGPARSEANPETEEAATLYRQSRKIIHLRHSDETPPDKPQADSGPKRSTPTRTRAGGRKGGSGPSDTVPSTPSVSSQPPGTPPASRARVLPSTPSTPSSQHRRLPSPPTIKRHPTPPSVTSPPVNRDLPTPPLSGHRRLPSPVQTRKSVSPPSSQWKAPSPPASRRAVTPNSSMGSYPLKAPSPPASPRVQRWTRENSGEEIVPLPSPAASRRFNNARSVFCPASPGLFEAQPCPTPQPPQAWASTGGCVLPRPWGESARGRLPTSVRGPRPFVRRSHSDRRPSLTCPAQAPAVSVAHSCGSEPSISTQGLEDGPTREEGDPWGSQPDLRAANRSASHPDLCIVGQALQR